MQTYNFSVKMLISAKLYEINSNDRVFKIN